MTRREPEWSGRGELWQAGRIHHHVRFASGCGSPKRGLKSGCRIRSKRLEDDNWKRPKRFSNDCLGTVRQVIFISTSWDGCESRLSLLPFCLGGIIQIRALPKKWIAFKCQNMKRIRRRRRRLSRAQRSRLWLFISALAFTDILIFAGFFGVFTPGPSKKTSGLGPPPSRVADAGSISNAGSSLAPVETLTNLVTPSRVAHAGSTSNAESSLAPEESFTNSN
jgi:hypothetical protein